MSDGRERLPLEYDVDYSQKDGPEVVRRARKPDGLDITRIDLLDDTILVHTEGIVELHAAHVNGDEIRRLVGKGMDVTITMEVEGYDEEIHIDANALVEGDDDE